MDDFYTALERAWRISKGNGKYADHARVVFQGLSQGTMTLERAQVLLDRMEKGVTLS